MSIQPKQTAKKPTSIVPNAPVVTLQSSNSSIEDNMKEEVVKKKQRTRTQVSPNENIDPAKKKRNRSPSASTISTIDLTHSPPPTDERVSSNQTGNAPSTSKQKRRQTLVKQRKQIKKPRKTNEESWAGWPKISDNFNALRKKELRGFTEDELEVYRDYVKEKYEKVIEETKGKVEINDILAFHQQRENFEKTYKIQGIETPKPCVIKKRKPNGENDEKEYKTKFYVTSTKKLPSSKFWNLVENNYVVEDRLRLSHIPYIEDGNYKTSEKDFIKQLWEKYPEGIHGSDAGCGKHISRYEFFLMLKLFKNDDSKDFKDELTRKKILFAFFTLFPNFTSYQSLQRSDLFESYQSRFEKDEIIEVSDPLLNVLEILENICVKCGLLKCLAHRNKTNERARIEKFAVQNDISTRKCSDECGFDVKTVLCKLDPSYPKFENDLVEQLFLMRLGEDYDICKVAKQMATICDHPLSCKDLKLIANTEKCYPPPPILSLKNDRHKIFKRHLKNLNNGALSVSCDHEGPCEAAKTKCPCFVNKTACSLDCRCGYQCKILFPGCKCVPGKCRTKACSCVLAGWECNPITCTSCNSDVCNIKAGEHLCSNIAIQNGWRKRLAIGISTLPNSGIGLFAQQDISKSELISEYCGETISESECDRRGVVYDECFMSYTFALARDKTAIDAARMGNLVRFANHIPASNKPNCAGRMVKVNGELRIGIFAECDIKAGEELFFDYGYSEQHAERFHIPEPPTRRRSRKSKKSDE